MLYIAVIFILASAILSALLIQSNRKVNTLNKRLFDTSSIINERLALADKYSKMVSLVANKTVEACIITDKDGYIEWVNNAFTDITGYYLPEVIGKKPGVVLQGPETDKGVVESIREKLKQKVSFKEEILNYHKTGYKYWLSLSITPVLDHNGNIEKFIAIESDITERKKFEDEMKSKISEIKKS